jgi:hypothetical protein
MKAFSLFLAALLFLLTGCSDDATVIKNTTDTKPLSCLRLVVFPPDKLISDTLTKLYDFTEDCQNTLQVSQKSGIVCNSNQNADKKALSNFPSGYIRMDVMQAHKMIYSYYKDLTCKVSPTIVEQAFHRLKSDLLKE